jgi:hypothetical protein
MNNLHGTAVSAFLRAAMSYGLNQATALKGPQLALFNVLDMIISSTVSNVFAHYAYDADKYDTDEENETYAFRVFIAVRIVGFVSAAGITTLAMGPVNWGLLLLISAVAQTSGILVVSHQVATDIAIV